MLFIAGDVNRAILILSVRRLQAPTLLPLCLSGMHVVTKSIISAGIGSSGIDRLQRIESCPQMEEQKL